MGVATRVASRVGKSGEAEKRRSGEAEKRRRVLVPEGERSGGEGRRNQVGHDLGRGSQGWSITAGGRARRFRIPARSQAALRPPTAPPGARAPWAADLPARLLRSRKCDRHSVPRAARVGRLPGLSWVRSPGRSTVTRWSAKGSPARMAAQLRLLDAAEGPLQCRSPSGAASPRPPYQIPPRRALPPTRSRQGPTLAPAGTRRSPPAPGSAAPPALSSRRRPDRAGDSCPRGRGCASRKPGTR
jgi:hypothetical protein